MALNRDHRYKFSSDKVISGLGPNTTMVNENLQPLTKLASDTEVDTDTELDSITMASPIVPQCYGAKVTKVTKLAIAIVTSRVDLLQG